MEAIQLRDYQKEAVEWAYSLKEPQCVVQLPTRCVPADTEFLSQDGWKKISEYKKGDLIAQWDKNTKEISFIEPLDYIVTKTKKWVVFEKSNLKIKVTPEHRMPYYSDKKINVKTAKELFENKEIKIPRNFTLKDNTGTNLTKELIKVLIMQTADGSIIELARKPNKIRLNLKLQRKKERAVKLLKKANISFTLKEKANNYIKIVYEPPKEINFKDLSILWKCNKEEAKIIYKEMLQWDGSIFKRKDTGQIVKVFTGNKKDCDLFQYVASIIEGTYCTITKEKRKCKNEDIYTCKVTKAKNTYFANSKNKTFGKNIFKNEYKKEIIETDELAYCFTTKTGFWLMRQNNNIIPTGNSGKSIVISELAKKFSEDSYLVVVLTETSALIDQLDRHLSNMAEPPNIIKAGKHRTTDSNIWLIMEQSFHKDSSFREDFEPLIAFSPVVVLRDEISKGFNGKRFKEIIDFLQIEKLIGFDATPIDQNARAIISKKNIRQFITVNEVIKRKYWKKPIYIIPKEIENIDLSEVKTSSTGDYITSELSKAMQDESFITTVLHNTNKKYPNKKWIVYCVDIAHAEMVTQLAKQVFEGRVEVVHSKKSENENENIIKLFKEEEINTNNLLHNTEPVQVLVSVMSLTIGFDSPIADGIINFRPTKILKLWHQFGSRANTPYKGKDKAYIIDAGMCAQRLGFLEEPLLMLEPNTSAKEAKRALKSLDRTKVISYMQLEDRELKFEDIELYEQQYKEETTNIYKMKITDLINLFKVETDFWKILEIATEIWNRIGDKYYSWNWIKEKTEEAFDFKKYEYDFIRLSKNIKNKARAIIRGDVDQKFGYIPYHVDKILNDEKYKKYMIKNFGFFIDYKEPIKNNSWVEMANEEMQDAIYPEINIDEDEIPF